MRGAARHGALTCRAGHVDAGGSLTDARRRAAEAAASRRLDVGALQTLRRHSCQRVRPGTCSEKEKRSPSVSLLGRNKFG